MAFKFEKLKVWQKAIELSGETSELTDQFSKKEMFVHTSQIQRASDSIVLSTPKFNQISFENRIAIDHGQ